MKNTKNKTEHPAKICAVSLACGCDLGRNRRRDCIATGHPKLSVSMDLPSPVSHPLKNWHIIQCPGIVHHFKFLPNNSTKI